jgi:hypothetical protein
VELNLLEKGQKGLKVKWAKITMADMFTQEDILEVKQKLTVLGSRGSSKSSRIYRTPHLCPLNKDLLMAKINMEHGKSS